MIIYVPVVRVYAWLSELCHKTKKIKGVAMKLKKFFLIVFATTCIALLYTQMQFNIYVLAYHGKEREQKIVKLIDENSYAKYNVAKLRSVNNLGLELFENYGEINFFGSDQIVHLKAPKSPENEAISQVASVSFPSRGLSFLSRVFSLKSIAEARQLP